MSEGPGIFDCGQKQRDCDATEGRSHSQSPYSMDNFPQKAISDALPAYTAFSDLEWFWVQKTRVLGHYKSLQIPIFSNKGRTRRERCIKVCRPRVMQVPRLDKKQFPCKKCFLEWKPMFSESAFSHPGLRPGSNRSQLQRDSYIRPFSEWEPNVFADCAVPVVRFPFVGNLCREPL